MKPTIFIPTYNSEKFIARTLDSLVAQQGIDKFPICVIDNNSTDKTRDIARSYTNVEVFKNEKNIGRIQNWNKCLDMFKTQKVFDCMKFVFVGDILKPNCLRTQLDALNSSKVDMVTCVHEVIKKEGNYIMKHFYNRKISTPRENLVWGQLKGNWIAGCMACPLFTKEALGDTKFNTKMAWAADWMFWTQLSERISIKYLIEALVEFHMDARKGYTSLAGTHEARQDEEFVQIYIQDKLNKI
jgi:glycosyltransferase involved in cell wall biosynthesis